METNKLPSIEDLIIDVNFCDFVLNGHDPHQYWSQFIDAHPEFAPDIEKASQMIIMLSNATNEEITFDKKTELQKLKVRISNSEKWSKLSYNWLKYAAVVALFIGLFALSQSQFVQYKKYEAQQSNQDITLSDRSSIQLKQGSTLKVSRFYNHFNRNLQLSGEAFFKVARNEKNPFMVTMKNTTVTVLGTQFLIQSDDVHTNVLVREGKVAFRSLMNSEEVYLTKGMSAETDAQSQIRNIPFNINQLGWATGEFHFNHQNLPDILHELENYYHVQFIIAPKYQERNLSINVTDMQIEDLILVLKEMIPELDYNINNTQITLN